MRFDIQAGQRINGSCIVPGDKSISHRAVMLASLAEGTSSIYDLLLGDDVLATIEVMRNMGVSIDTSERTCVRIQGVGLHGLQATEYPLYFGNSGTSMRLMMGVLSAQGFSTTLVGDVSLSKRPMMRIARPLSLMGADIETSDGKPPIIIKRNQKSKGIEYHSPVSSAQIKSAILLAGLYAQGRTLVVEPTLSRDHTERMLRAFGVTVYKEEEKVSIEGNQKLQGCDIHVPADISSAAFFMVGASIAPQSEVVLKNVGVNPTRMGIIHILKAMGADINLFNQRQFGEEPVADIRVRYAQLKGIEVDLKWVASAIDEFPVLFIAAACAQGRTIVRGAAELRVKESDRIAVMADAINRMGGNAQPTPDGMIIEGRPLQGGVTIDACHDHRIGMACAIASLACKENILVEGCETIASSFPSFEKQAMELGLDIRVS